MTSQTPLPVVLHPIRAIHPTLDTDGLGAKLEELGIQFFRLPEDGDLHEESYEQASLILEAFNICAARTHPLQLVDCRDDKAVLRHAGAPLIGNPPSQFYGRYENDTTGAEAVNRYALTDTFKKYAHRDTWIMHYDDETPDACGPIAGALTYSDVLELLENQELFGKQLEGKGGNYHLSSEEELLSMLWDMGLGRHSVTCQVQQHVVFENEKRFIVAGGRIVTYSPRLLAAYPGARTKTLNEQQVREAFYQPFDRGEGALENLVADPDLHHRMLSFAQQVADDFAAETGQQFFVVDCGEIVAPDGRRSLAVVEFNNFNQSGIFASDTKAIAQVWADHLGDAPKLLVIDRLGTPV